MRRAARDLKGVLHPKSGTKAWVDVLMLAIFGTWFLACVMILLPTKYADGDACNRPGFADFSCAGGWEAIVGNVIFMLFMIFLFSVAAIASARLINRSLIK